MENKQKKIKHTKSRHFLLFLKLISYLKGHERQCHSYDKLQEKKNSSTTNFIKEISHEYRTYCLVSICSFWINDIPNEIILLVLLWNVSSKLILPYVFVCRQHVRWRNFRKSHSKCKVGKQEKLIFYESHSSLNIKWLNLSWKFFSQGITSNKKINHKKKQQEYVWSLRSKMSRKMLVFFFKVSTSVWVNETAYKRTMKVNEGGWKKSFLFVFSYAR